MDTVENKKVSSEDKPSKQKWSLKKKLGVILGSILVFIIGLVVIANMATSAPLRASDDFIGGILSVNSTAAYKMFSSDAKKVVSEQDFSDVVDRIGPILTGAPEVQSKEVSAETGSDATAKVVYSIKGNDGNTYLITVNLVNENNEWKVLNFDSKVQ